MFLKKERWNICLFKLKQHYRWYCLKKENVSDYNNLHISVIHQN